MASAAGPIADLSYRNYDGPMFDVGKRWWVIAKMLMRQSIKKKGFWWWTFLSTWGYVFLSVVYYFMDALQDRASNFQRQVNLLDQVVWKDQFYLAFEMAQLWLLFLSILIGASLIAADTRANALLVYLSKPVSKADYLFGKWLGMFLLMLAATGIPALLFLGFSWLSYRQQGAWDSWLFFRALLLIPIPAILHSSIMLGLSSLFTQPRLAGATYAGVYFISMFVAGVATGLGFANNRGGPTGGLLNLSYFSIDGIIEGLSKVILNTQGAVNFIPSGDRDVFSLAAPNGLFVFGLLVIACAIFWYIAWKKVRAVEVVGS